MRHLSFTVMHNTIKEVQSFWHNIFLSSDLFHLLKMQEIFYRFWRRITHNCIQYPIPYFSKSGCNARPTLVILSRVFSFLSIYRMTLVFFMLDKNHPEHTPLFKYSSCVYLFFQTMDKSAIGGKLFFIMIWY